MVSPRLPQGGDSSRKIGSLAGSCHGRRRSDRFFDGRNGDRGVGGISSRGRCVLGEDLLAVGPGNAPNDVRSFSVDKICVLAVAIPISGGELAVWVFSGLNGSGQDGGGEEGKTEFHGC